MPLLTLIPLVIWIVLRIVADVTFDQDIGGHLKRAADANTVELARQELDIALKNMESRGCTEGYTSIVYRTPDEDVGFWYENITSSYLALGNLPPDTDALTISNELMKLRETLLDHKESGEKVTAPEGISIYPHNVAYVLSCIACLALVLVGLYWAVKDEWFD